MNIVKDPYAQQVAHVQSLEAENANLRAQLGQLNGRDVRPMNRSACQNLEYNPMGGMIVGMGRMMLGMGQLTVGMSTVAFAPFWAGRQVVNGCGNFARGMVGMMFMGPLLKMYDESRIN